MFFFLRSSSVARLCCETGQSPYATSHRKMGHGLAYVLVRCYYVDRQFYKIAVEMRGICVRMLPLCAYISSLYSELRANQGSI